MEEFVSVIRLLRHSSFYYIVCINMKGEFSYVNSHYSSTFKYIDDVFVGKAYNITMHPDDMKVCEEVAALCFSNPEHVFPATIRKLDGNGSYIITQWEYKAMFDNAGLPEGIFCLGHDITELDKKKGLLKEIAFYQSHNIRRPLANIMGIANILSKMDISESIKNLVDMMIDSSAELDTIIRSTVNKTYE